MTKEPKGKKTKHTIEYFKRGDNDQQDHKLMDAMKEFLGKGFKLFKQSVCFNGRVNKTQWKGVRGSMYQDCVCWKTFLRISHIYQHRPHVALVEGVIGRIASSKLPRGVFQPEKGSGVEFHSLLVIVDPIMRTIGVFNPWLPGQVRSGVVKRVQDIRPKLVSRLLSQYKKYNIYHSSGKQVHTSDCRVHCLRFAKLLGKQGRYNYLHNMTEIIWKPIKH